MIKKKARKELTKKLKSQIGKELREARLKHNKTRAQIAQILSRTQITINNIERGCFHHLDLGLLIYMLAYYDKYMQINFVDYVPE